MTAGEGRPSSMLWPLVSCSTKRHCGAQWLKVIAAFPKDPSSSRSLKKMNKRKIGVLLK